MPKPYSGGLSEAQQTEVKQRLKAGESVRSIGRDLEEATYGQVRYYAEWLESNPTSVVIKAPQEELPEHHLKVLVYDIETAPLLAHVWHTFGDYVSQDQLLGDQFMLTWAAKWYHDDNIMSDRLTVEECQEQDDTRLVANLAELLREADVIIAHNGDRFDLPVVNKRLMLLRQEPLPPITSIDTLKLAKKNFKMEKNSLDFLAERLLGVRKLDTDWKLWRRAYQAEEEALEYMEKYNRMDVEHLEGVFDVMKPYVRRLKRFVNGPDWTCPFCGSTDLQRRGVYRTQVSTFQRWQCQNCFKYSRSKSLKKKRHPLHPL